jgi:hypothetical protein
LLIEFVICFLFARCGFVRLEVEKVVDFILFLNVNGQKFIPKRSIEKFLHSSDHNRLKITYLSDFSDVSGTNKFDESNLVRGHSKNTC